jgi:hypothetical protein
VTPTQFGHSRAESDSMVHTAFAATDEGPGRICPQVGPRSVSINWGIELPLNPFARHPTFLQLAAEGLGPREIHARLRAPEMKARLLAESEQQGEALMRAFVGRAPDLKVLRGEAGEYEVPRGGGRLKLQAAAEARGVSIWELAYDELVLNDSILSMPLSRREGSLEGSLTLLQSPVTRFGLGDAGAHLTSKIAYSLRTVIQAVHTEQVRT